MYSNNKQIRDVAAVAAQIMSGQTVTEKLHPNQQKIDVVDDEKIDAKDFAKLRAMKDKVKEEVEQIDELTGKGKLPQIADYHQQKSGEAKDKMEKIRSSNRKVPVPTELTSKISAKDTEAKYHSHQEKRAKSLMAKGVMSNLLNKVKKEEVEQVEEMHYEPKAPNAEAIARKKRLDAIRDRQEEKNRGNKSTSNVRKVEGNRYGGAKQKDEMDESVSFTSLLNTYKEGGLKPFLESLSKEEEEQLIDDLSKDIADETMDVIDAGEYTEVTIGEEADTAEFTKTLETNKLKASGRVKQPDLAKGDVMAVKNEEVEQVEEKHMTDAEMNKRETIVKSMKKGLSGFKQRYGDKAKNVMYATATKQAMK